MALSLAKPKHRSLINPSLVHLFSSSSSTHGPNFGASSADPPVESTTAGPPNSNQENPSSFKDLYRRHVSEKLEDTATAQGSPRNAGSPASSYDSIRQTLRGGLRPNAGQNTANQGSLSVFRNAGGAGKSTVIGGTRAQPLPMFAMEAAEGGDSMATEFVKVYSTDELGDKLRSLRPEVKGKGWFSLEELNERLRKLRAKEDEESAKRMGGFIPELRQGLLNLKSHKEEEMAKKSATHRRLNLLFDEHLPPKEHLVEKYFHPDNMSSAEKLKLELANVREEFKMSESDCGSARVQVAQLTTKIKHLSSALHKKDKHSRKGLNEMVQRRKKLLKYLRRTDWDSYCFVLSKLGLRDNADMKH